MKILALIISATALNLSPRTPLRRDFLNTAGSAAALVAAPSFAADAPPPDEVTDVVVLELRFAGGAQPADDAAAPPPSIELALFGRAAPVSAAPDSLAWRSSPTHNTGSKPAA